PAVVLLHGFSDNGLCWTRIARVLETDYDVVMPDARNHGLSSAAQTSQELIAADVAALIQELDLQSPRLIGHSMGAATAARVAADYPTLVHSVILEDPPIRDAWPEPPKEGEEGKRNPWQWVIDLKSMTRDEMIATARKQGPTTTWSEEELGPWADSKLQLNLDALNMFGRSREPMPSPYEILERITCPILLITADPERGAIVTPEAAQKAASIWHDGRVVHIAGAGHNIRREQYDKFIEVVTAFLKEK
ncbi:MAG TPA: alpha/beta hydrolase, partial [Ktedonobacteraceae bacterium]|nr:alpha/beta hydrolase [Ktedonobacteraceae bacterium]